MFGVDTKKIKAAFAQFWAAITSLPPSQDPVVQAIVKFIQALGKAFD